MKKNILSIIKSRDYEGLESELSNLKTNQKFLNETLKWASYEGDAKSVQILINFGANPNYADEFGTTVLHFAVKGEKEDIIKELIVQGANFSEWENEGINLFHWCIRHGLVEVINLLVENYGIDLSQTDDMDRSPLHLACMFDQLKVVKYLLKLKHVNVNQRDQSGWTCLHYACSEAGKNFREILEVLFKNKADPLLLTNNSKTSLDLAYESGKAQELIDVLSVHKMIQLLVSVDNVIVGDTKLNKARDGWTAATDASTENVQPSNTKLPEQRLGSFKLSLWRKIMLNDDVELLEQYRDSAVWYDLENPGGFEECQNLDAEGLCAIFRESYENGVGIYSHFNHEFRAEISSGDLLNIISRTSGISSFSALQSDGCTLLDNLHQSILFTAFISGRFKLVEMLLRMRQFDIIPACLIICLLVHQLRQKKDFPQQIVDNLVALSTKAELIAVDVLNRVYFIDNSPQKEVSLNFLSTQLSSYGNKSLIDLADAASCSNFLSLPCCQVILDRRWYGNLRPLRTPVKWIIRFIPVSILFYNPYNNRHFNNLITAAKIRYHHSDDAGNDVQFSLKDRTGPPKPDELPSSVQSENNKFDHVNSLSRIQVLYAVVNAPGTKFFYHSVAHLIFLVTMSYILLFDFMSHIKWPEILCWTFVVGYAIEEVVQCILIAYQSSILDYLEDKWNWLDLTAILTTAIGFGIKLQKVGSKHKTDYYESMDPMLYVARVLLLYGLLFFYLRILFISTISENLGPKLRMIVDMLKKDFLPLLFLFAIFILAFGVLFQGMLYPNGWYYLNSNTSVPKKMMNSQLAIVGHLLKRATYGIFEADFPMDETNCDDQDYCVHPLGKFMFLSFFLIIYILIVYIMLMNLLIALFSNTVSRIDERSMEHWLAGRYKLVQEYKERSIFPPPFNLIERFYNLIMLVSHFCKCSNCCNNPLFCSYRVILRAESDVNVVVKYIIIQSFALKTCRYTLGSKDSKDVLGNSSSSDKSEYELKMLHEKVNKIEVKLDKVLSAFSSITNNTFITQISKDVEEAIVPKVAHFKFQEIPSKRSSKIVSSNNNSRTNNNVWDELISS